ncbi:MAG TPA: hypothetical protein DCM62_08025 [Bacteroidales bacterium]|nr:hypothetical protein [Bacteroidales bacterium]
MTKRALALTIWAELQLPPSNGDFFTALIFAPLLIKQKWKEKQRNSAQRIYNLIALLAKDLPKNLT